MLEVSREAKQPIPLRPPETAAVRHAVRGFLRPFVVALPKRREPSVAVPAVTLRGQSLALRAGSAFDGTVIEPRLGRELRWCRPLGLSGPRAREADRKDTVGRTSL